MSFYEPVQKRRHPSKIGISSKNCYLTAAKAIATVVAKEVTMLGVMDAAESFYLSSKAVIVQEVLVRAKQIGR